MSKKANTPARNPAYIVGERGSELFVPKSILEGTLRPGQVPVTIQGVWLRREGGHAVVLVERDGRWIEIIREALDAQFSHICEPAGIRKLAP